MADPLPDFPNRIQNGPGNAPDADEVMDDFDHIRDYLNARLGNLTNAQLLIANGSGQVVGRTLGGDGTINNTGTLTLAAGAVGTAKLADSAVNSAKVLDGSLLSGDLSSTGGSEAVATGNLRDNAVTKAKMADAAVGTAELEDLGVTSAKLAGSIGAGKLSLAVLSDALSASDVGIPATWTDYCSVTPAANATYLVMAVVNAGLTGASGQSNINVRLLKDGAAAVTIDEFLLGAGTNIQYSSIPILTAVTTTTTNPIKLQAQREGVAGITVQAAGTRLVAVRIG